MIRNWRTTASRAALLALVAVIVTLLVPASPAGAIQTVSTAPADGARVQPPATIEATHDISLSTTASTITLKNKNGIAVAGATTFATDSLPNDTIVFTPTAALTETASPYTVSVHAEDVVSVGDVDTAWSFTIDTTKPATPTIATATNPVNASNQAAVTVTGTAEASSTVEVTIDDESNPGTAPVTASVAASGLGAYSTPLNVTSLSNGALTVSVTATDEAGNESSAANQGITKDAAVPSAPTVHIDDDPITAANQGAVDISGTSGESGLTISLSVDDATRPDTAPVTTSTTSGGGGAWSATVDLSSLAQGTITATARATDPAGNQSTAGTDTAPKELGAPELVSTTPAGDSSVQSAPEVTVTYNEALSTGMSSIVVEDNTGTPLAGSTTFRDGNRTIVFTPVSTLPEAGNPYEVTAAVKDAAGNAVTPATQFSFTIDTTAPDAPVLSSVTDPVNAANQAMVEVAGQAETGSTVEVTISDTEGGSVSDSVQANSPFEVALDVTELADGTLTVTATATDPAGNTSDDSEAEETTKDTAAPDAPTVDAATDPVNASNADEVEVSGAAEAGATVDVTIADEDGGTVTGAATATEGAWSVDIDTTALTDGTLTITAVATDGAGNPSDESEPVEVTKDTVAPAAPIIQSATDPVRPANAHALTVTGTAAAGVDIDVVAEDSEGGTATDSATGTSWTAVLDASSLEAGTLTITATATDANGNTSVPSDPVEVHKAHSNVVFQSVSFGVGGDLQPFAGDFDGDGVDDVFWYGPGAAPDSLWLADGDRTFTPHTVSVRGTYVPVAGDFDGDGADDILWYAAGTTADPLWLSDGDGTFTSSTLSIKGTYVPVPGDFDGDGTGDILWYAAGTTADPLWLSDGDGTFTSSTLSIKGTYLPVPGDFDGDEISDVFWYGSGTSGDHLWFGDGDGTFTGVAFNDDGVYRPLVGDFNADGVLDVFKYRPGSGVDELSLRGVALRTYSVSGTYRTATGDFDGDGDADILWYAPGSATDAFWFAKPQT